MGNMDVAEIAIGGDVDYERLGMKESSRRAALVDMLRDNGLDGVTVTYSEIKSGIHSSGMEKFLSTGLKSASDYLLLDKPYVPVTGSDIAGVIREGATLVRNLTGRELSDEDYTEIVAYFDEGDKLDDVSLQALSSVKLREYTPYTKNLLSLNILGALLLINIMLIVVLVILGRAGGSAHVPIGWGFIISGIAVILGGLLGLFLFATTNPLFVRNRVANQVVGVILNITRSIPFLILMILLLPLSKVIVGTKIGSTAVIVPLSIASIAFFARLAEASFSDVNKGVLEAAVASGSGKWRVIWKILFPEALPSLVKNITVTAISILGFSAMAGLVGGGGLGDLAYRYGYQRYQIEIMIICVLILIILVQLMQWAGDLIAKALNKQ